MIMSAQDARGPEDEEHERAWRPAVRQERYQPLTFGIMIM
jgi:hypothetical protein